MVNYLSVVSFNLTMNAIKPVSYTHLTGFGKTHTIIKIIWLYFIQPVKVDSSRINITVLVWPNESGYCLRTVVNMKLFVSAWADTFLYRNKIPGVWFVMLLNRLTNTVSRKDGCRIGDARSKRERRPSFGIVARESFVGRFQSVRHHNPTRADLAWALIRQCK